MSQFLGSHQTRLDAKGRTSVPAAFRAALRNGNEAGLPALVLRPSHRYPCIEGWTLSEFERAAQPLQGLDLFSEDADDLAYTLCAQAWSMEADREGRIILPDALVQHANLTEAVTFMGLGFKFQIWEPAAGLQRVADARANSRSRGLTLPAGPARSA